MLLDLMCTGVAAFPPGITVTDACTLGDAIEAANNDAPVGSCTAGSGADEVYVTHGVTLVSIDNTTDGDNGLPSVISPIVLRGNGYSIERHPSAPNFRILHVGASGDLTLHNTVVSSGNVAMPPYQGGGIFNAGTLALVSTTVSGNSVRPPSNFGVSSRGGGIYTPRPACSA